MAKVVFNKEDNVMAETLKMIGLSTEQGIMIKAWLVVFSQELIGEVLDRVVDGMIDKANPISSAKELKKRVDEVIGRKVGEL